MNEVVLDQDVPLHHLTLDLLFNFFIKRLKCTHDEVIRIIDTSSHLGGEHLDHVVIVAGSSHLGQHRVELFVHHQSTHVVEGSSQVILVDDTVLVNVHQSEAFFVHLKS